MSMFYGVSRLVTVRKHACMLLEGLRTVLNKSSSTKTFLLNPLIVRFFARNGLRHVLAWGEAWQSDLSFQPARETWGHAS